MNYIITYTPDLEKAVINELKSIDKSAVIAERFGDFIARIETKLSHKTFINKLLNLDPIFIKHIMPVDKVISLSENGENALEQIYNETKNALKLDKGQKYSVQARMFKNIYQINSKDIEVYIGSKLEKEFEAIPTFSDYELTSENILTLSIMVSENNAYLGVSKSTENLNSHSDEYRICSRRGGRQISRAENKLKEAITKFGLNPSGALAMDIGAAPGGWTKVLADYGFVDHAVDPGDLHPELLSNPKI
jgi:23S rRNA (cytidine2498-2'-O)-methyltransferase